MLLPNNYDTIYPNEYERMESTMSIIVALKSQDYIVIATDSQLTRQETYKGETNRIYIDGWQKLDIISKTAIAGISNSAGYESHIIDKVGEQINSGRLPNPTYDKIKEQIAIELSVDSKGQDISSLLQSFNLVEFVLAGVNGKGQLTISRVLWEKAVVKYVSETIKMPVYVTGGITALGWHLFKRLKVSKYISTATLHTLKRLATFVICESSKMYDSINDDIQMVAIGKDNSIDIITSEELETLKKDVVKLSDNAINLINEIIMR